MHWRLAYPSEYLNAADLLGKQPNVVIDRAEIEEVPGPDGKKKPRLVFSFRGHAKRWPVPKCCAKLLAHSFGKQTEAWIGKTIQLYETECMAFGETVECIRIRVPATGTTSASQTKAQTPDPAGNSPQDELASVMEVVPFDAFVRFAESELGIDLTACGTWDEIPTSQAKLLLAKHAPALAKCRKETLKAGK